MTAVILKFPLHRRFDLCLEREADGEAWLVRTHDRERSWLHGDYGAALNDAGVIAAKLGVAVRSTSAIQPIPVPQRRT